MSTVTKSYRWSIISKYDLCSMLLLFLLVDIAINRYESIRNRKRINRIYEEEKKEIETMPFISYIWLNLSSLLLFTDKKWRKMLGRVNGAWWWWWWWSEYPGALKLLALHKHTSSTIFDDDYPTGEEMKAFLFCSIVWSRCKGGAAIISHSFCRLKYSLG